MKKAGLSATYLLILVFAFSAVAQAEELPTILNLVKPAVVSVVTDNGSLGSGFIVNPEGYIVTCAHVVEGSKSTEIKLANGNYLNAQLMNMDQQSDLAILKSDGENLPCIGFSSKEVETGQSAIAIGTPEALELDLTVSNGIISNHNRQLDGRIYLQTNIAVNPGNSGGPLLNDQGMVIGVVSSKLIEAEGIAFAVPATDVLSFLKKENISVQVDISDRSAVPVEEEDTSANTSNEAASEGWSSFWVVVSVIAVVLVITVAAILLSLRGRRRREKPVNIVLKGPAKDTCVPNSVVEEDLEDIDIDLK